MFLSIISSLKAGNYTQKRSSTGDVRRLFQGLPKDQRKDEERKHHEITSDFMRPSEYLFKAASFFDFQQVYSNWKASSRYNQTLK